MSYEVNHPLKIDSNLNHLLYEVLNARVWHVSFVTQINIYTLNIRSIKKYIIKSQTQITLKNHFKEPLRLKLHNILGN